MQYNNQTGDVSRMRLEQLSTRLAFLIAGVAIAAWAPLVPFTQARAHLDERMLGLLLLCLGTGSIIAMPLAGALAARFGCRRIAIASSLAICVALPLLATASAIPVLVSALFVLGAGLGSLDCVMNIQAVIVERNSGRPMMSGFHGLFSVGGIVGAGGVSALLSAGATPLAATLCVVAGIVATSIKAGPHLLSDRAENTKAAFAVPHGIVLLIGILCFIVFLAEGSVLDWSAVFLISTRDIDPAYAGLGYAAFATTMTLGRLTGDIVVRHLGGTWTIALGGLCAATGLAIVTAIPLWQAGVLGYGLAGAGCSNIVPVLYTAVGRQKSMPEHTAVSTITTMGYGGIMAGPAAIGLIAHATSLPTAFLIIAVLLLAVGASSWILQA
jgi:predicted MFS family arabinose efflux permease